MATRLKDLRLQGESNRQAIISFLKLNNRWYSTKELSQILNINEHSVRAHCTNLVNSGQIQSTYFHKHLSKIPRRIEHFRYRH